VTEPPSVPEQPTRRCGYHRCRQPLHYDGRGRPPEYCPDRRWPDGRTCKQLAAAERSAERLTGLDAPLEAFQAAGERFVPAAESLARQLRDLVDAVDAVRQGALARVGDAEQVAAEAGEQSRAAAAERDRAIEASHAAERERTGALQRAEAAEQQARDARSDADTRIEQAWRAAAEADHARGAAEAAAATRAAEVAEQGRRRELAERRADDADARVDALTDELAAVVQRARDAESRLREARTLAEAHAATIAHLRGQLDVLRAGHDTDLRNLRTEHDARLATAGADLATAQAAAAALRDELAQTRAGLAAATEAAAATRIRAETAEARLDRLIAALPSPGLPKLET